MPISYNPPGGGGGSALNAASGPLTKIVESGPATFTIVTADGSGFGTMTLTVAGTPHAITFGNAIGPAVDVATYSDDGATLVNFDAATVSAALRTVLSSFSDITTGGSDPSIVVTTVGTGAGATLDVSISGRVKSPMYPSLP
jgi:hypothetical protein